MEAKQFRCKAAAAVAVGVVVIVAVVHLRSGNTSSNVEEARTMVFPGGNDRLRPGGHELPGQEGELSEDELWIRRGVKARLQNLRELGIIAPEGAPNFLLVGEDGKITRQAIVAAGLSEEQARESQDAINGAWAEVSNILVTTAIYDEDESDPDNGVFRFRFPSFEEAGAKIIGRLEQDLTRIAGASAPILLSSFDPTVYPMGFGRFEGEVTVLADPQGGSTQELRANYVFRDADTGTMVRKGEAVQQYFHKHFGSSLEKLIEFE